MSNFKQAARNQFVKDQIRNKNLTVKQLKNLPITDKRYHILQIESAFISSFFAYTRDKGWMENAVGDAKDWIELDGMAAWHVSKAISALEKASDGTTTLVIC